MPEDQNRESVAEAPSVKNVERWRQQLADAEWRHEQAENWATEGAVETAKMALAGDVAMQRALNENPAWQTPGSPLFEEFIPLEPHGS